MMPPGQFFFIVSRIFKNAAKSFVHFQNRLNGWSCLCSNMKFLSLIQGSMMRTNSEYTADVIPLFYFVLLLLLFCGPMADYNYNNSVSHADLCVIYQYRRIPIIPFIKQKKNVIGYAINFNVAL